MIRRAAGLPALQAHREVMAVMGKVSHNTANSGGVSTLPDDLRTWRDVRQEAFQARRRARYECECRPAMQAQPRQPGQYLLVDARPEDIRTWAQPQHAEAKPRAK